MHGVKNLDLFRGVCLNLNDYQFKTNRYKYRSTRINPMVTTDETWHDKYTKIKLERKKHKHTTKENHQTTKKDSKGKKK